MSDATCCLTSLQTNKWSEGAGFGLIQELYSITFPSNRFLHLFSFFYLLLFPGSRPRFRGNSNSNNPNLMYQDECDRRIRSVGSNSKDSRSYSRGGSSRDGDRSSSSTSSYRDRSSRDGGRSYGSGSNSNSYEQYQSSSSRAGSGSAGGGLGQVPPSSGPQPLMAQQFNPPQPMMGLMGHSPFQFPPPPPSSGRK